MFDENGDANDMLKTGLLQELQNNARIIVCLFSSTRELTKEFMQAAFQTGMSSAEYAYILPWLQSGPKDTSPWIGSSGEMLQRVKDYYANAIIVDDVNGFDDSIVETFINRLEQHDVKKEDIDIANIFGYLHLYDSLKMYALAVRKVLNETKNNATVLNDGLQVWNAMRRMSFEGVVTTTGGATGTVNLDDLADRAPLFAAFYIAPNKDKVLKMVNMESVLLSNCNGIRNQSGCYDLKMTDVITGFWPSENGQMPSDEPYCGFRGQRCSYTLEIGLLGSIIALIILSLVAFLLFRHCQTRALNKMPWRVFHDDLRLIDDEQIRSMDIIYNKNVILDEKFHGAFVRDITLGLEYLHASPIGYHGSLTPWSCLIDRNWMVKLTDYGVANPLERWEKQGAVSVDALTSDDDKSQAAQRTSPLYCAPEMLKNREVNRRRGVDQSWIKQTQLRRQAGDIYAFGMVMYEILFRSMPYPETTDITQLLEQISDGSRFVEPQIQDQMSIHPDLCALLRDCWSENPEIRPSIRRVRLNTEMALKTKGSLVDQMMRIMEQYANNLEKLVKERTGMLEEANLRADKLLSQLLPKYVANELKLGRAVPPKLFTSATVLFSDIVGFTGLCSTSTPLEVVNMLNGIYSGFDDCIQRHGAYKVETIGDAYMVVSGIPEENGTRHIQAIAEIALEMRDYLVDYEIPHRRSHRIKCRWGFHTGSVAAGVVGLTAPRYCLFGDTVNTSSRMESTGLPEMIQISTQAKELLLSYYPHFKVSKRGEVEVKASASACSLVSY
ncbi:hypothetical protein QR680_003461 [Steinernema hermaphroditum]|uniref:Guanylate cyclase n=1 Tax=Steinernema hermaphroditum TaxID=289476 RepID=A0AA39LK68_9BILA|nr:hypothetical protein QR680_003461 [Steinernema hermaphroditum]